MKLVLLFWGLLLLRHGASQSIRSLPLPVYLGLTAYNKRFQDPFSSQVNLGSLAQVNEPIAGVSSEMKFMQTGLNYFYGAFALPLQSGGLGFSMSHVGFEGFVQSRLGLSYSRKLSQKAGLGIQINYHRISIAGYGAGSTMTAAVGAQFQVTEKTVFGFQIDNPVSGYLGASGERLASAYSAGIGSEISDKVFASALLIKSDEAPAKLFLQLRYTLLERLGVAAGCSVTTSEAFVGSLIAFRNIEVRQITSWNQGLGISPAMVILFHLKKDK